MKIVIVGAGKVGLFLTQALTEEEHDVTVVDIDPHALARMQESCDALAVLGHGATRQKLAEAAADSARLLIATTGSDEINLLCCLTARKMGCRHTIARVRNPEYNDDITFLREDLGLSFAINPEEAVAREIFQLLQFPSFLERDQFAKGRVEIVGFTIEEDSPLVGVPLAELYRVTHMRMLVCAIEREEGVYIPDGDFVLQQGDDMHIAAAGESLPGVIQTLHLARHKVTQVTVVGGSRVAIYLVRALLKADVGVKVIERDYERCQKLAELLPQADVVYGDGTELDLLESEGVARSDALVALTGIDEENLVLAIFMEQLGVPTVIAKSNRMQYSRLYWRLGLDSVVSPTLTSGEDIIRYVRAMENSSGGKMLTMHSIVSGKVEAMEFRADDSCGGLEVPLRDLQLKKGLLVGAITRGRMTIIPGGNDSIQCHDSVVIVSAEHLILDLNDILEES